MSKTNQWRAVVFEDDVHIGQEIWNSLRDWGFAVLWVIKILWIRDGGTLCLCLDPTDEQRIPFTFFIEWGKDRFDIALVDGQLGPTGLPKDGPHGWDVLPKIRSHIPCVLISSGEIDNAIMRREHGVQFASHHKLFRPEAFKSDLRTFLTQLGLLSLVEA